jgi:hypothetical protein
MDVKFFSHPEEGTQFVFDNKVLKGTAEPMRDGVKRRWIKLHNEALHNCYSSRINIKVITPIRMNWVGHVVAEGLEMRTQF